MFCITFIIIIKQIIQKEKMKDIHTIYTPNIIFVDTQTFLRYVHVCENEIRNIN